MPLPPRRVTNPEWRSWLSEAPGLPPRDGQLDVFHRASLAWLRAAPSLDSLDSAEANDVAVYLMDLSRRMNIAQRSGVDHGDTMIVSVIIGFFGALVAGPAGAIAGAVYGMGAVAYDRKLDVDHRRRQNMIDEIDDRISNLIDRLQQ